MRACRCVKNATADGTARRQASAMITNRLICSPFASAGSAAEDDGRLRGEDAAELYSEEPTDLSGCSYGGDGAAAAPAAAGEPTCWTPTPCPLPRGPQPPADIRYEHQACVAHVCLAAHKAAHEPVNGSQIGCARQRVSLWLRGMRQEEVTVGKMPHGGRAYLQGSATSCPCWWLPPTPASAATAQPARRWFVRWIVCFKAACKAEPAWRALSSHTTRLLTAEALAIPPVLHSFLAFASCRCRVQQELTCCTSGFPSLATVAASYPDKSCTGPAIGKAAWRAKGLLVALSLGTT